LSLINQVIIAPIANNSKGVSISFCHSRVNGNPVLFAFWIPVKLVPAKAGTGMTNML